MKINLLPQRYTPDGEISIELLCCNDEEAQKLIDQQTEEQQRNKGPYENILTCHIKGLKMSAEE